MSEVEVCSTSYFGGLLRDTILDILYSRSLTPEPEVDVSDGLIVVDLTSQFLTLSLSLSLSL